MQDINRSSGVERWVAFEIKTALGAGMRNRLSDPRNASH